MRRTLDVIALTLLSVATLGAAAMGLIFSSGGLDNPDELADVKNVTRVTAGALGGFAVACAAEMLAVRRRDIALQRQVESMQVRQAEALAALTPKADGVLKLREELPPWTQAVRGCRDLKINGLSLRTFTNEHLGSVRTMLARGGICRFLLLAPDSSASAVTAENFLGHRDPHAYNIEISASLRRLHALRLQYPGTMKIRTLNHIPAASIAILTMDTGNRVAFVEFYTEESSSTGRPHLQLDPIEAPVWFSYFDSQFDTLWKRGTDFHVDSLGE